MTLGSGCKPPPLSLLLLSHCRTSLIWKRGEALAFDAMPLAEWVGLADNLDEAEPFFNRKNAIYGFTITSLVRAIVNKAGVPKVGCSCIY